MVDIGYRHLAWQIYLLTHDAARNNTWSTRRGCGRHWVPSSCLANIPADARCCTQYSTWPVDPTEQRAVLIQKDGVVEGRIEVFHDMDDCRWASITGGKPESGYWAHFAPGSGAFLSLGRSQATHSHDIIGSCILVYTPYAAVTNRHGRGYGSVARNHVATQARSQAVSMDQTMPG